MNKESYQVLFKKLKPQVKSLHAGIDLVVHVVLITLFYVLIKSEITLLYCLSQLVLGIIILRSLFLMHDCAHGSLTKSKYSQIILGHFYGALCFLPYFPWKYLHLKHHTYAGIRDVDPLLVITGNKKPSNFKKIIGHPIRIMWRMGVPYAEVIRSLGYILSPVIILKRGQNRKLFVFSILSVISIYLLWKSALTLAPEVVTLKNILPGFFVYLVLNELVSLPQHLDLPSAEKEQVSFPLWQHFIVTRSVIFPSFIARHVFLNFNLHTEHHFFPKLPWRQLVEARDLLKSELGLKYQEASWDWSINKRKESFSKIIELKDVTHENF